LADDLLKKLLTLDPKKRITAKEALTHDYFWTQPPPALPEKYIIFILKQEYK